MTVQERAPAPYKFYGPHLGLGYVRAELASQWRTYKVRPATHSFETGTLAHELLAGFVAAVEHIESIGWDAIQKHERALGQRFLDGLPEHCWLYGLDRMDKRVPTFAFNVERMSPRAVAEHLGERDIAVWDGDYYAAEVMKRLGLDDGAVRVGFVHYNSPDEVDRLLEELAALG
jgi:selenocysteine lyase/cysteine desulfurase